MNKFQNLKKPILQSLTIILVLVGLTIGSSLPNPLQAFSLSNQLAQLGASLSSVRSVLENLLSQVSLPVQTQNDLGLENKSSPLPLDNRVASYEEQITRVVEKSNPSAVSIIISKDLPVLEEYYINPFQQFGIDVPGDEIGAFAQLAQQEVGLGGKGVFLKILHQMLPGIQIDRAAEQVELGTHHILTPVVFDIEIVPLFILG